MCEIQLIHKFDGKKLVKEDLQQFIHLMWQGSMTNDDAYGWYDVTNKSLSKTCGKLEYTGLQKILDYNTSTLFGHNRFKTKGDAKFIKNNHPFETENFVVVHNGMIGNDEELKANCKLNYKVETDSYIIPALLEVAYKDTGNEVEAISKVASVLSGSFSCVVYCKPSNRLFYFKSKNTSFNIALVKTDTGDILFGSTRDDNFKGLYNFVQRGLFKSKKYKIEVNNVNPETILEFTPSEILNVGTFREIEWGDCKMMYWNSETKTFIKDSSLYKVPDWNCVMGTSHSGYGRGHSEDNIKDKSEGDEEDGLFIALLKQCNEDVTNFIKKTIGADVINSFESPNKGTVKTLVDRTLNAQEKTAIEDEFAGIAEVVIKDRVQSKLTEVILTVTEYNMYSQS